MTQELTDIIKRIVTIDDILKSKEENKTIESGCLLMPSKESYDGLIGRSLKSLLCEMFNSNKNTPTNHHVFLSPENIHPVLSSENDDETPLLVLDMYLKGDYKKGIVPFKEHTIGRAILKDVICEDISNSEPGIIHIMHISNSKIKGAPKDWRDCCWSINSYDNLGEKIKIRDSKISGHCLEFKNIDIRNSVIDTNSSEACTSFGNYHQFIAKDSILRNNDESTQDHLRSERIKKSVEEPTFDIYHRYLFPSIYLENNKIVGYHIFPKLINELSIITDNLDKYLFQADGGILSVRGSPSIFPQLQKLASKEGKAYTI